MYKKAFHYIVKHEDDIKKMLVFTQCPLVEKFAYVKHDNYSGQCSHYHFYFVVKCKSLDVILSELTGVNGCFLSDVPKKEGLLLQYFLREVAGDVPDMRIFKTNIEGFKKYNAV